MVRKGNGVLEAQVLFLHRKLQRTNRELPRVGANERWAAITPVARATVTLRQMRGSGNPRISLDQGDARDTILL